MDWLIREVRPEHAKAVVPFAIGKPRLDKVFPPTPTLPLRGSRADR